ncbi:hypothetical protein [Pseudomonas syringae group genomosp. 3]|uniref:hypothetical protein n=1 Tax=Pseudomonas syringae group genomosp. 3 TaxID=251701 RepID=UPI0006B9E3A8|nr:hypothetical protein [Pseudomonas syringae group genomosp. 3]KPB94809.1 Uncharacterized protein AC503_0745 [Pseudomonas syringae pv. maculicola]
MAKYKVAHIHEQGNDMIIIPLDSSFNSKTGHQQADAMQGFQVAASSAGLRGQVVLIWQSGGYVKFIGPQQWHPFLKSPGIYQLVMANINKELTIH